MSPETIQQKISEYYNHLMSMNLEGWLHSFAPDALILDPVGKPPLKIEDADKFFSLLSSFYQQFAIKQDHVFIVGNEAAVKWTMEVTAKNGRSATAEGISVFEINQEGKMQQLKSYWDENALKAQLMR